MRFCGSCRPCMGTGKLTVCVRGCSCLHLWTQVADNTMAANQNTVNARSHKSIVEQRCLQIVCVCVCCVVQGNGAAGLPEVSCQDMSRHCHSIGSSPLCLASQPACWTDLVFAKNSNIGENILRAESIRKFWVVGNSSHVIFEIQGTSFHKNLRNETVQFWNLQRKYIKRFCLREVIQKIWKFSHDSCH